MKFGFQHRAAKLSRTFTGNVILILIGWESVPACAVNASVDADVRFAWKIQTGFKLAVAGHDLLHSHHDEFGPQTVEPRYELPRGALLNLTHRL